MTWLRCFSSRPSVFPRPASPQDQPRLATSLVVPNPALPPSVVPLYPSLFSYLSTPAFPPSVTTHHSRWTLKEIAPLLFFSFVCLFPIGCDSRFPFCCFFRFQSPRSLRIDCHQSLSGLFLPLSEAPARPRRTSGYTVGWSFLPAACAAFLSFVATELPAIAGSPLPLPFSFPSRAFARPFPFSFPLVVSANSLTGLPNLVSAWFLLSGGSIPLHPSPVPCLSHAGVRASGLRAASPLASCRLRRRLLAQCLLLGAGSSILPTPWSGSRTATRKFLPWHDQLVESRRLACCSPNG